MACYSIPHPLSMIAQLYKHQHPPHPPRQTCKIPNLLFTGPSYPLDKQKTAPQHPPHSDPQETYKATTNEMGTLGSNSHMGVLLRLDAERPERPPLPPTHSQEISARHITITPFYPSAPIPHTTQLTEPHAAHPHIPPRVTYILSTPPRTTRSCMAVSTAHRTSASCPSPHTQAQPCK